VRDDDAGMRSEREKCMALGWYGYGRWSAPYWFVGIEPGGDELDACVRMWEVLGREELLDIAARHGEFGRDWFGPDVTEVQKTWQKLIWLLMYYKGEEPTARAVLEYQKMRLGRADGETALPELSSLPAVDGSVGRPRVLFRSHSVAVIRQRLLEHSPEFAVFYSPDNRPDRRYVDAWSAIVGTSLVRDEPVLVGRTACVMTYHPNGAWSKAYWEKIARVLKAALLSALP